MSRLKTIVLALAVLVPVSGPSSAQPPAQAPAPTQPPPPTDRTKATRFSAEELRAALAKLPTDRPSAVVRVFSLAPYNVNVEQRQPRAQGASLHEAQAELFYVIEGSATLLTGGTLTSPTRTGTNQAGPGIDNGVRTPFSKGDFLIVPSGVPHQFVDIGAPIHLLSIYLPNTAQ
jgi:mannose-6-phosphate isomerase-like protein (cupin superfamily)